MAFAKAYREEITLAYYCCNLTFTIAIFIFGTIYLRHRDRRDQQRKEWRQFAEIIRSEYIKLKAQNIPCKISKVKDTFGNVHIYEEITGLDVLRCMLDADYKCTKELETLGEDLNSIFQLLNTCASLILLGTVPNNIRAELGKLVTELSEITLPFYRGEERAIILKCLKHFGSGGKSAVKAERRMTKIDARLEGAVPYVQYLRFGGQFMDHSFIPYRRCYSECRYFRLELENLPRRAPDEPLNFLKQLHVDLQNEKYTPDFARELRQHLRNLKFVDGIASGNDKLVLVKVLHEIRVYIHLILNGRKPLNGDSTRNIEILRDVHELVTKIRPDEEIVRYTCERFMTDLSFLTKNMNPYHKSQGFRLQLQEMYGAFCDLIIIREHPRHSLPPNSTGTENYQYESCV